MKIHVEVFIASKLLEQNQGHFSPHELVSFIEREFHDDRPGVQIHATAACVANAPANFPKTYNYLWREDHAKYRTFKPGHDQPAQGRENSAFKPEKDDVPQKFRYLLDQATLMNDQPKNVTTEQNHSQQADPINENSPSTAPEIPPKKKNSYRSSASFGKRQEYIAVAELLRRGHDVYMTLVDDQQIDCVIRQEKDGQLRYLDIQIKARSFAAKNPGLFAAMEIRAPRENFFYIFYSESINTYWIIPSMELVKQARQNKEGKNRGRYTIIFANIRKNGVLSRPKFSVYENAFHLLEWN